VEIVKRQAQRQILLDKSKDLAAIKYLINQPKANSQEQPIDLETMDKIRRARLIVRVLMIIGIALPILLFFLVYGWPFS
tara:strand:- start:8606 stop:8842 length:237 start_codon:yes stop_codon:yes gene_type:complete